MRILNTIKECLDKPNKLAFAKQDIFDSIHEYDMRKTHIKETDGIQTAWKILSFVEKYKKPFFRDGQVDKKHAKCFYDTKRKVFDVRFCVPEASRSNTVIPVNMFGVLENQDGRYDAWSEEDAIAFFSFAFGGVSCPADMENLSVLKNKLRKDASSSVL